MDNKMRIFCHMVVGPGEADRFLVPVMDRVRMWADFVHVTLDHKATIEDRATVGFWADAWEQSDLTWEDHEAKFRTQAWHNLELTDIQSGDFVLCLDADEVVVDHSIVRPAAIEYPDNRITFLFHEMWSEDEYRTDGYWKPYPASIMFPYHPNGHFRDRALACGREPTYVTLLPQSKVVGHVLHYGYSKPEYRKAKYERYMRLDGGRFHARSHLDSILADRPSLQKWERGGLL